MAEYKKPMPAPEGADGDKPSEVERWTQEFQLADNFLERWHNQAKKTVRRFLDDGEEDMNGYPTSRLNLFYSNVITMQAILYAKLPKVEADRRWFDPNDDVARVAAEMVTRVIQNDLNKPDDATGLVLKNSLEDRLVPGNGTARIKYCMEEDDLGNITDQWCETLYVHWQDIKYSPCRTSEELRWKAYRSYLTKEEVEERFGPEIAADSSLYSSAGPDLSLDKTKRAGAAPYAKQCEVWEIWDKTTRKVYWFVKGARKILDTQDDPLELGEFFPDVGMIANASTSKYLPKPDYCMSQDLYVEIDELETRIRLLTAAARCVGVYDKSAGEVQRMFTDGVENQLIPVDNWAMFAEKGGMKGVVDWLPIEAVVNAIQVLSVQQAGRIQQLYQVTGMSDIMRGQATQAGVTATEQRIKAQFGSTRMQRIQQDFADFAQTLLNKKVQIIQRFYDPQRIVQLSNVMNTTDAQLAEQAVQLIKSPDLNIRIMIRSESMAQVDYDALKQERTEYLQAASQFIGQSMGLIEAQPESAPFLLQLMKFGLAAYKGGQEIEGVMDSFIAAVEQKIQAAAQQPPQPPPEVQIKQAELQVRQQEMQMKAQLDQQKAQAAFGLEQQEAAADMQIEREKHELEKQKLIMEMEFMERKFQLELQKAEMDAQIKLATAQIDQNVKLQEAAVDQQVATEEREFEREAKEEDRAFEVQARKEDRKFEKEARRDE